MAVLVIVLVALSRIYLGVHYPTDVASGIALGAAWAFLLAGFFSLRARVSRDCGFDRSGTNTS
jgi:undecaprenyl-diphosphatase